MQYCISMAQRRCGVREQNVKLMPYHLIITDVLKPTINQDKLLTSLDHFNIYYHPRAILQASVQRKSQIVAKDLDSLDEDSDKWRCPLSPTKIHRPEIF